MATDALAPQVAMFSAAALLICKINGRLSFTPCNFKIIENMYFYEFEMTCENSSEASHSTNNYIISR